MKRKQEISQGQPRLQKLKIVGENGKEIGKDENQTSGIEGIENFSSQEDYFQNSSPSLTQPSERENINNLKLQEINKAIRTEEKSLMKREQKHDLERKQLLMEYSEAVKLAKSYNLPLKGPEIVLIGLQGDGKSTLLEALLGFQFNYIDHNQVSTRRTIIIQVSHDPEFEEPEVTFFQENLKNLTLEPQPTPLEEVEKEIKKRMDNLCQKGQVISKFIVLKIKYKYCIDFVVYDTPGFRKNSNDPNNSKIQEIIKKFLNPNRLFICVEQAHNDLNNIQTKNILQEIDPKFEKTIFVQTKFHHRLIQFKNKEEIDSYLGFELNDLYFLSLPSGNSSRNITSGEYKEMIKDCYMNDYSNLLKLGFDKKFLSKIGIYNLRRNIHNKMNQFIKKQLDSIISPIEKNIISFKEKKEMHEKDLKEVDQKDLDLIASKLLFDYINLVHTALKGTTLFDPLSTGQTLDEEKKSSGISNWPNYQLDFKVRNEKYRLYGGSQLERLIGEFEIVAHSQEFPNTTDDEVAVTIGLNSLHSTPDYDRGANDLAIKKSDMIFRPLISVLIDRSKYIMKRTFDIVITHILKETSPVHYKLMDELKKISEKFVEEILVDVSEKTNEEFETFTRIIDCNIIENTKDGMNYDLLNPTKEDTLKRLKLLSQENPEKIQLLTDRSKELNEERCKKIKTVAATLFAEIRLLFVKYIRSKFHAFFLNPIFTKLDQIVRYHFTSISKEKLKILIGYDKETIQQEINKMNEELKKFEKQKENVLNFSKKF